MGYTVIDLFAGAGGMTAGFKQAGFEPVFAVELDPDAAATYRANFGDHVVAEPIESVSGERFPQADVVMGGPPCQGFSPLGRMTGGRENSALNGLWREYARVLATVGPAVFVLENVPEILKSAEFTALQRFVEDLGYEVRADVLNAANFGVPQKRRRAIVVGTRIGEPRLPVPNASTSSTVDDAIGYLPPPKENVSALRPGLLWTGLDLHFKRTPRPDSLKRYKLVPPGGNRFDLMRLAPQLTPRCWLEKPTGSTDVFGRLRGDEPALTIRTEFFKPEKGRYLHPTQHRPITHLEAALLQTFPPDFKWSGSKISIARQIGNAVPPRLAQAVALEVAAMLDEALVHAS